MSLAQVVDTIQHFQNKVIKSDQKRNRGLKLVEVDLKTRKLIQNASRSTDNILN